MKNPALTRWLVSPDGLATHLKAARARSGLSGQKLADGAGAGWSKARVSKIENGTQMPTGEDVRTWARLTGVDPAPLLDSLAEATRVHLSWRSRLSGGQAEAQRAYVELTRDSANIWSVDRELIPGELQTSDYAAAVLTQAADLLGIEADVDGGVAARLERQELLAIPSRSFELLIGEAALRNLVVSPAAMVDQCQLIRDLARLRSVKLGVIPQHRPLSLFPHPPFVGYDRAVVIVEGPAGDLIHDSEADIEQCRRVFDGSMADALTGKAADQLIADIITEHENS